MKLPVHFVVSLLLPLLPALAQEEERTISLEGIVRAEQIKGHLGEPLGTVMKVDGIVRLSPLPEKKASQGKGGTDRFILVTHVNGKKLATPTEIEILPRSSPKLQHGEAISVQGFERLMTIGTPKGLPKPAIQARGKDLEYHLASYLDIVTDDETSEGETE
jgi:hypothetical protein